MKLRKELTLFIILGSMVVVSLACVAMAPTPEPTVVPTEEPTAIPIPTEEPTAVQTVEQAPETETISKTLSDGSTEFTDAIGGYQLVFPENWFLSNLSEDTLDSAFDAVGEANPEIPSGLFEMSKGMMTEDSRFFAIDTNEGHYDDTMMTAALSMLNEAFGELPLDFLINSTAQALPQQLPDAKILSSGVEKNQQGVEVGVIEVVLTMNDVTGSEISIYERMLFIQNNKTTTMMILLTDTSLLSTVENHFDQIQNSITLIP